MSAASASIVCALLCLVATLAAARSPATQTTGRVAPSRRPDLGLVLERETFSYPASAQRDPFTPFVEAGSGPRFDDLQLRGVIHASDPDARVALLTGPHQRIHRVRTHEQLGNARVVEITPHRVTFAVDRLGTVRHEHLELPRPQNHIPR